jgi:hypothetical protein
VTTAPSANTLSQWITITHPFHPLCGHKFQLLKSRNYQGVSYLSLRIKDGGTLSVPTDWTCRAESHLYQAAGVEPTMLSTPHLFELAELLKTLNHSQKGLDL